MQQPVVDQIAETAELIIFCLQKQNIVKMDRGRIIHAVAEHLAALQHSRAWPDIGAGIGGRYRPARSGTHRMFADAQTARVHKTHIRQRRVGRDPAVLCRLQAIAEEA